MNPAIRRVGLALLAGLSITAFLRAATPIFPLDQVKAGLKGKGRTVFTGTSIEEFDAEILGVLSNPSPKRSIIIARLSGNKTLAGGGVIAGMSGSPVYIEGKILGAVAYGFAFSKDTIAGITPIGEMLALSKEPPRSSAPSLPSLPFSSRLGLEELLAAQGPRLGSSSAAAAADGSILTPLKIPLLLGGFSPRAADKARSLFGPLGFLPMLSGGGQAGDKLLSADLSVQEGDAVSLLLVSGDLEMSAVGTVTHVDGNRVLAFGHPLYNLGGVGYGMAKAKVITVVPTLDNPTKLAASGGLIGTFIQDRTAGALGVIGRAPKFVPVNINLIEEGPVLREFKLNLTADKLLTPLLLNVALSTLLTSEKRSLGDLTFELAGDVYLDNRQSIHLEDMFTGNLDAAASDICGLVTAVTYFLTNNEFADVGIFRVDLNIKAAEGVRRAKLERIWLDKYEAAPGETITLRVFFRGYRGETQVEEVPFLAPRLPSGSEFQLIVGDAASMSQVESGLYRAAGFTPRSMTQLIRVLNSIRKNNRIYFKILAAKPGLFLRGEEMPNLPPGLKSMFTSPRAAASGPTDLALSTLSDYQMPVPFVFEGRTVVPVRIR